MRNLFLFLSVCAIAVAQVPTVTQGTFDGQPAMVLANGKLELTVSVQGASFTRTVLREDPEGLNPFWDPARMARETGAQAGFRSAAGHFICADGFGPVSPEERAAGLPGHGEAHRQTYETRRAATEGRMAILTMEAILPMVQEKLTRTIRLVEGENVVYVDSRLENLLGFDRPVNWAEHATVGSPFLESGATVVDVSGSRSMTRPYEPARMGAMVRRLASGKEFTWPMAPGLDGQPVDLRETPRDPHYLDHAATLIDPNRRYGWTTALNKSKRLLIGYLFRREEFPWVQYWGSYPPSVKMARGLEFSTQPFDVPRREVLSTAPLFGAPMVRWLPAKSAIETHFLFFYVGVPEGMARVTDVRLEDGRLLIEDRAAGRTLRLATSAMEGR